VTDQDDIRLRKALQGKDFPASRNDLVAYATDRGDADEKVVAVLSALPEGTYTNMDEAIAADPQG
jgi:Protein of unknown function (DUF2795)